MRLPAGPDGRRMTQVQIGSWRVTNGAASFCDAFTQQPPEDVRRARACLAYIQVCCCAQGGAAVADDIQLSTVAPLVPAASDTAETLPTLDSPNML